MIQRSIHYKSDFKLRLANEIDWSTPFKLRFFTTRPVSAMEVSYDGTTYKGCSVDTEGKLVVTFDRFTQLHRQGLGALMMELSYNIDDDQFADRSFDRILAPQKVVCTDDENNEFELVLGLNGDSHVEVECSVIAAYKKGDPGDTPEIGENGNWWIGGVDTEVKADYSSEEALRQSQEAARVAAETARANAETTRQSNEAARQSAETARDNAEATRQTNETARQGAETQRQQTFSTNEAARQTAYQNAEANRNGAYQEAEQDRDEEFASKEATRDAANQAALNCAETLAALGPKIDELKSNVFPFYNGLKEALLLLAEKVTYIDEDGQNYYDILYNALYVLTYPISYHLSHCVSSNNINEIDKNASYSSILTVADGYTLENASVVVKMGGNTITTTAYEDGEINIPSVSGPLEITVSAVSLEVVSISAAYTQSGRVENTDTLDVLKKDLIVTATFVGGVTAELNDDDYMLSGSLSAGESTITVQYGNVTDTFEVTVDEGVIGNNLVPFASLNMRPDSGISATFTNNELVYSLNNKAPWGSIAFEYKTNYLQTVLTNGKKYRFHANFELLSGNNVRFAMSPRKSDGTSTGITATIIYDSGEYIMEWVQTSSVGYIMLSLNEFTATYTAKLTDMWIKEVCED